MVIPTTIIQESFLLGNFRLVPGHGEQNKKLFRGTWAGTGTGTGMGWACGGRAGGDRKARGKFQSSAEQETSELSSKPGQ